MFTFRISSYRVTNHLDWSLGKIVLLKSVLKKKLHLEPRWVAGQSTTFYSRRRLCSEVQPLTLFSTKFIFSACTVTQRKIKMQTGIQYRRTRIREMKKDKYTKTLAKNQVCEIFQMRDIGRNGLPNFIKLCMEMPCQCPFQEHPYGRRIPTETSVFEFSY